MTQSDLHSNAVGGLSLEARVDEIVLFHNDFSPIVVSSPNNVYQLISYNN